jgi:hypothetical protein
VCVSVSASALGVEFRTVRDGTNDSALHGRVTQVADNASERTRVAHDACNDKTMYRQSYLYVDLVQYH